MPDTPVDFGDMSGEYNHKMLRAGNKFKNHLIHHILH